MEIREKCVLNFSRLMDGKSGLKKIYTECSEIQNIEICSCRSVPPGRKKSDGRPGVTNMQLRNLKCFQKEALLILSDPGDGTLFFIE